MAIHVGASSWTSDSWWGRVYPKGLADGERLSWYAQRYDCVEVDATYYAAPSAHLVRRWALKTPEAFRFTLKLSRDLLDPKRPLDEALFDSFHRNAQLLGSKLSAILLQFPPWVKPGRAQEHLTALFQALQPGLRYAFELRDAGWYTGAAWKWLEKELRDRNIALCWSYLTYVDVPPVETTDFLYVRFIGDHTTVPAEQHGEIRMDRSSTLSTWAERIRAASSTIPETFVFFNNHFAGFAPESINAFRRLLDLPPVEYQPPRDLSPNPPAPPKRTRRLDELGDAGLLP